MQRYLFSLTLIYFTSFIFSQSETEIFLLDLKVNNGNYELLNGKNISNNEGYDNQPSFVNDNAILFSSTRNGQTDIIEYRDNYGTKTWLNFTEGGEYTPLKIPNTRAVSAVRLDKDGKQRLYSYKNGESTELIKDLVVAYYTWYNENIIVSAVIEDTNLNLYASNLKKGWNRKYDTKVGRSFHKIPNSNLVSYISKKDSLNWKINSLNPLTGQSNHIANTIKGVEDICWLINGSIISGKGSKLYRLNPKVSTTWQEIADLKDLGITKITRIASNSISSKLLIAAEIGGTANTEETNNSASTNTTNLNIDAGAIVQAHIAPYNRGDLEGFANAFAEDIVVSGYPNEKMYEGRQTLKENYSTYFKNNSNLSVSINNRIVLNQYVIDEELYTFNNTNGRHVAIYTTAEDGIKTMTFVGNTNVNASPEIIVNKQLEAYNKRDIDAFMKTYTNDVKLYNYPDKLSSQGQESMRKNYQSWFDKNPDLYAKIIKRFIIGNKVIDFEEVRANRQVFKAIAIYEVDNGLIKKVTFIK